MCLQRNIFTVSSWTLLLLATCVFWLMESIKLSPSKYAANVVVFKFLMHSDRRG